MKEEYSPDFVPENLKDEPGAPGFIDLCEQLIGQGKLLEALYVALRGVSHSDDSAEGKLLLAKIFFKIDCIPYAVREVEELHQQLPQIDSLSRLLEKIAPERVTTPGQQQQLSPDREETLAEGEFDFSEIELMDED